MKNVNLIRGLSAALCSFALFTSWNLNCAQYNATPSLLGLLALGIRPHSSNPVGKIYSGTTPMTTASQAISLGGTVDTSRSIVLCYYRTNASSPNSASTCHLTDSTTIQVDAGAASASYTVQWYVVEFTAGTSVQRGLATFAPADLLQDIGISSVDTSKSFTMVSSRFPEATATTDQQRMVRSRLTSSTNLRLARSQAAGATCGAGPVVCNVTVAWQVIQLNDANIQSNEFSMTTTSATQTLSAINLNKSFVIFSSSPNAAAGGVEGDYLIAPALTNSTTLTFNRGSAVSTIAVSWYVIEMTDDSIVQSSTSSDTAYNPATPNDVTLPIPINDLASISTVYPTLSSAGSSDLDVAAYTPTYTSGSVLRLTRGTTDASGPTLNLRWTAIQFVAQ